MSTSPADNTKRTTASMATTFAGVMLLTLSIFQIIEAITALAKDDLFVSTLNYTFEIDVSSWGWIHLILGICLFIAGWGLFSRKLWAGMVAIVLALLTAIENFFFIPYYPWWSLLVIAVCIWVMWALTRPDAMR